MRATLLALTTAVLLFAAGACGGSSTKTPTATVVKATPQPAASATPAPTPLPETAFAKSMLLTLPDFPPGWIETPVAAESDNSPLRIACGNARREGATGRAVSNDFMASKTAVPIAESVTVFPDEATAAAAYQTLPSFADCSAKAMNDAKLDGKGIKYSAAESTVVALPGLDGKTYAYQLKATVTLSSAPTRPQTLYLLSASALSGRVIYTVTANGSAAPPDPGAMAGYVQTAGARVRQQP